MEREQLMDYIKGRIDWHKANFEDFTSKEAPNANAANALALQMMRAQACVDELASLMDWLNHQLQLLSEE